MKTQIMIALLAITLAACAPAQTAMPVSTTTFTSIVEMPTILPTYTPLPALPTFELLPTSTAPTALPTQTPLPASLPKFPLDGYVMLFTKDGDLYFQDGNSSPVKLAHIEGKGYPPYFVKLSDDNQKVVFYQENGNIYSINTDGTQEQIIIPSNWADSLEAGTLMEEVNFVPKTHLLSFQAVWCKEKSSTSPCSKIIFLADTDTGEVRKLADLGLTLQNFNPVIYDVRFSPNGKMMAVGVAGNVKIYTLDGKIIRQNILPFMPSKPGILFPSLFWLPDSSGLIAALPDKTVSDSYYMDGFAPAYTIWRYMLDGDTTVQISFDPPVAGTFEVSSDGNWIVYGGISPAATELYLGNLADGSAKAFGNDLHKNFSWSPDSKHFIHGQTIVLFFDKTFLEVGGGIGWVDSNHFINSIYYDLPGSNPAIQQARILIAEIKGDEVNYYELGFPYSGLMAIRPKQ